MMDTRGMLVAASNRDTSNNKTVEQSLEETRKTLVFPSRLMLCSRETNVASINLEIGPTLKCVKCLKVVPETFTRQLLQGAGPVAKQVRQQEEELRKYARENVILMENCADFEQRNAELPNRIERLEKTLAQNNGDLSITENNIAPNAQMTIRNDKIVQILTRLSKVENNVIQTVDMKDRGQDDTKLD